MGRAINDTAHTTEPVCICIEGLCVCLFPTFIPTVPVMVFPYPMLFTVC